MKEVLSLIIGPSRDILDAIKPMEPCPWNFFIFPSFILISITDDNLPPYLAGKPPLTNLVELIASELNTEKKPNK